MKYLSLRKSRVQGKASAKTNGTYYFQLVIPQELREKLKGEPGCSGPHVLESLKTDSLAKAEKLRDERLLYWRAKFARARQGAALTDAEIAVEGEAAYQRMKKQLAAGRAPVFTPYTVKVGADGKTKVVLDRPPKNGFYGHKELVWNDGPASQIGGPVLTGDPAQDAEIARVEARHKADFEEWQEAERAAIERIGSAGYQPEPDIPYDVWSRLADEANLQYEESLIEELKAELDDIEQRLGFPLGAIKAKVARSIHWGYSKAEFEYCLEQRQAEVEFVEGILNTLPAPKKKAPDPLCP